MSETQTLRGLATVTYWADDLEAAKDWYSEFLGLAPYFQVPGGYYEFRLGDYQHELGIIDAKWAPPGSVRGSGGHVAYWHVDDLDATVAKAISLGATLHEAARERGPGFVTATVIDPFGNVLGLMYNKHYLEILGSR
ncbi:putative enzyme related to lactoylglutathione lyase [Allocatelliglobosispora scoriae]|uniref:Putative enzyme related to lactoylglutathione lyase n=1 Tax=Allocatelliglobosispora scoriae TaxID=643052 RepID=A0A841C3I1_9ACTN|nr:VOC family protein [Allocatelliglobosispora scoriae]MBB5874445.1 putative enzyme related to lactoylglutathione lyase [Allocatelliglobosispora scoriae]